MEKDNNGAPKAPKTLQGAARKLWQLYADELHNRQMFVEADCSALERLCILEIQADALTAQIAAEGATYTDSKQEQRRSPALMALLNVSQLIESLKRSLAIGGYYRTRIGEARKEEKPKSALMALRKTGQR